MSRNNDVMTVDVFQVDFFTPLVIFGHSTGHKALSVAKIKHFSRTPRKQLSLKFYKSP